MLCKLLAVKEKRRTGDEFDLKELKRYKKDSFYWYKQIIEENGKNI